MKLNRQIQQVLHYYQNPESYWGYKFLLKGTRHFGFYPKDKENLSMREAQRLMEGKLAEKLALPQNSSVLDAGCGEGNVAIILTKNYQLKITGVDLLSGSIKIAKSKASDLKLNNQVRFIKGDYTKINFPNNSFDGIYTMETLVHVQNYQKALRSFFDFLKPKGKLVLFEYTITHPDKMTKEQLKLWNDINLGCGMYGLSQFSHGCFPDMLKEAGFQNIKIEEITENVLPMVKRFYHLGSIPYKLIKLIGLENKFINAKFAVEGYKDIVENSSWKYLIISANKS